jgi:RNA polymerase sigma-70 factor, ECF subfamily
MPSVVAFKVTGKPPAQELEQVFKQYYQLVYRTAYSVTGNVQDAEDVLQSVFAGLARRELPLDLMKNPKGYLYRSAFNLSLNTLRYRKRHAATGAGVEALENIAAVPYFEESEELHKRLYEAIAELHPTAAQMVILRYAHDQSLAEIAKLLGTTRSTVAVTLFRSRARLKKLIRSCLENRS